MKKKLFKCKLFYGKQTHWGYNIDIRDFTSIKYLNQYIKRNFDKIDIHFIDNN